MVNARAAAKQLKEFFTHLKRRAQDSPGDQRGRRIKRLRRARGLIGSTDALERFTAWQAPEERSNRVDFSQ
jgi:hypothetical protein